MVYHEEGRATDLPPRLFPAMLGPVTREGRLLTYHVTYLTAGKKADVPIPRKILPGPSLRGSAIELYPLEGDTLGIAEGIETAIAAHMLHPTIPVWSAMNCALLKAFNPPVRVKHLVIFGDRDYNRAGQAAAEQLAHRHYGKVETVSVWLPLKEGDDWNDVLIACRAVANPAPRSSEPEPIATPLAA